MYILKHLIIIYYILLLLNVSYSPWTFNKAKPNERPNNVIKKQVTAAVTISGLAYGKILRINALIFKDFNFYKVPRIKNHFEPKQLMLA